MNIVDGWNRFYKIMKGKYIIIDLNSMEAMKDQSGNIKFYNTKQEAGIVCGMYEFENVWIVKLIHNHIEN